MKIAKNPYKDIWSKEEAKYSKEATAAPVKHLKSSAVENTI